MEDLQGQSRRDVKVWFVLRGCTNGEEKTDGQPINVG